MPTVNVSRRKNPQVLLRFLFLILLFTLGATSYAQIQSDSLVLPIDTNGVSASPNIRVYNFPPIQVKVSRIPVSWLRSPNAISEYRSSPFQGLQQQLSLSEYLHQIPGLFALNGTNRAQDLRIAIRGFGSRAAFGIRGIQLIVDGIPETTPDGQAQIDNLNLGIVKKIEVLRGPAAVLYGNASGGVIRINTLDNVRNNFVEFGYSFGSFEWNQAQLMAGLKTEKTQFLWQGTYAISEGHRQHSSFEEGNTNLRILHRFDKRNKLNFQLNYANNPRAQDPGGLPLEEVQDDRTQARDRNISFQAGEAIDQVKVGLSFEHRLRAPGQWNSYAFYSRRNFSGALPFEFGGMVDLQRNYWGQGSSYRRGFQRNGRLHQLQVGYELAYQADDRQRFLNLEGQRGDQTLDQLESFGKVGVYFLYQLHFADFIFSSGLRYDWNNLEVDDRQTNGEASDQRQLSTWNPSVGLSYLWNKRFTLFTNFRTGFETPTLSELSANPSGENGFNPNLEAQRSESFEIGWRYLELKKDRWRVALNYFYIRSRKELVPFELAAFPERRFFRNAGLSERQGLEASVQFRHRGWASSLSYTYSDLTYLEYTLPNGDFSGNQLPGIPKHQVAWQGQKSWNESLLLQLRARYVGELFTDDANTVKDSDYFLVNAQIGHQIKYKQYSFRTFIGFNNILNVEYNDNIRINAFGQRYFEPGPRLHLYSGVRLRWDQS